MKTVETTRLEVLAENYRCEAETCLEMAQRTGGPLRKELILAAAQWIELAQEAEARRRPN